MQVKFIVPLPPSSNHHILRNGKRYFRSAEYNTFLKEVKVLTMTLPKFGDKLISLYAGIHFKDRRRQDISNRVKCLEDALVIAGMLNDDRQVVKLVVERLENSNPAFIEIILESKD
jgi:Holliday junction resolvase RusA-like endonuclease